MEIARMPNQNLQSLVTLYKAELTNNAPGI